MNTKKFQSLIGNFYTEHKRALPWRSPSLPIQKDGTLDSYKIFVSEIMLQQTQVSRVLQKFPLFIHQFPSFQHLASASLTSVLQGWQGMGYNRRGKYLHETANIIIQKYSGIIPQDPMELVQLPGIGPATAGSLITFIYNKPLVFIETNIRRVFIHHFFKDSSTIHDKEIIPIVLKTLDRSNPREWYYALMDYGSYLAKHIPNPNRKSKHYTKQSKFEGSNRQVRGAVLQSLLENNHQKRASIYKSLDFEKVRINSVLRDLEKEGMVGKEDGKYEICK
jgi:A/G-specific adenine glycosylase